MKKTTTFFLLLSLFTFQFSTAQVFTLVDSVPDGAYGTASWGDFNNDGFKDLVYVSQVLPDAACKIYTFDGSAFSEINQQLPLLFNAGTCWGDLNNDSFDDLVVNGMDSTGAGVTFIYQSMGNGTFVSIPNTVTGLSAGSVDIADYNNDGLRDIAVSGYAFGAEQAYIYKNTGNFNFININAQLLGGNFSQLKWGDCDNDGLKDLVINGTGTPQNEHARLYKNIGADSFLVQNIYIKGSAGTLDLCDFDNDGWLDILITGMDSTFVHNFTELHHNNHNGTFTIATSGLPDFGEPSAAGVADYNNDGFADVCFMGGSSVFVTTYSAMSFNQGGNQFISQPFIQGNIMNNIVATADYDNDGDADLFFGNYILRNDGVTAVGELNADNDVMLYPNPASKTIFIDSEKKWESITIYNSLGAAVKSILPIENHIAISIDLPAGMYYVKLTGGNQQNVLKKFVVE